MAKQKKPRKRPSNCRKKTLTGECPGKYKLSYEDNAPIFTCDKCGDKDLTWKKFYNEYMQLFKEKENWNNRKHQVSCIIGFFCHMYKEFYNTEYIFVPKNPNPFGCKECKDAWSLLSAFGGDAHLARKYIYWLFRKGGLSNRADVVSFGYINTPGLIRRYLLKVRKSKRLTRASKIPQSFIDWVSDNCPAVLDKYELGTFNDLGALLNYVNNYDDDEFKEERMLIDEAIRRKMIVNNKLNVGA